MLDRVLFSTSPVPGYEDHQAMMRNSVIDTLCKRGELIIRGDVAVLGHEKEVAGAKNWLGVIQFKPEAPNQVELTKFGYYKGNRKIVFNLKFVAEAKFELKDIHLVRNVLACRTIA